MPFEYSCFISYRNHERSEVAEKFIDDLCHALRNELSMRTESDIFIDREGMRGGDLIDPKLSRALCASACMVLVYTPLYFNTVKTYCAREYRAMETLEMRRLANTTEPSASTSGLIFPIVLRGSLPEEIHTKRHFFDFKHFTLLSKAISRNREFEPFIRTLADQIQRRMAMLDAVGEDFTCDCANFNFPSEAEIRPWLNSIVSPLQPFPKRTT